LIGLVQLF